MNIATKHCPYASHLTVVQQPRWWGFLDAWRVPLGHGPARAHRPPPARRAPGRACRLQAVRWKRRRFVQKLRRSS